MRKSYVGGTGGDSLGLDVFVKPTKPESYRGCGSIARGRHGPPVTQRMDRPRCLALCTALWRRPDHVFWGGRGGRAQPQLGHLLVGRSLGRYIVTVSMTPLE